jgi:hypothetical protein
MDRAAALFWVWVAIWVLWLFVAQWYAFAYPVEKQVYFGFLSWWQLNSLIWYWVGAVVLAVYLNKFWKPVVVRMKMLKELREKKR